MTKFTIKAFAPDEYLTDTYPGELLLGSHSKTSASLSETEDGFDQIVLHGKNLTYNGDVLIAGKVTSIDFLDQTGHLYATMTEADFKISDMTGFTGADFILAALAGKDKVIGSDKTDYLQGDLGNDILIGGKGDDLLSGSSGDDTFTGGAGHDSFFFGNDGDNDTITDFDAKGGEGKQDHIYLFADHYTLQKMNHGHDTLVQAFLGDQSASIILLGVRSSEITGDDFYSF